MNIHDNLIYKAVFDFLEKGKADKFRISFKTDSTEPRYVRFYTFDFEELDTTNIELSHDEFLKQVREFKAFYRKMKASEMDDN